MPKSAGYSGTPLVKKLGIKPAFRIKTKNAPPHYLDLLGALPDNVVISPRLRRPIDLWHVFTHSRSELLRQLRTSLGQIRQNGMIWVSWPKKSSGVPSQVTEDVVRELALPTGAGRRQGLRGRRDLVGVEAGDSQRESHRIAALKGAPGPTSDGAPQSS